MATSMLCAECGEPLVSILERSQRTCAACNLGPGFRAIKPPPDRPARIEPPISTEVVAPPRWVEAVSDYQASLDALVDRAWRLVAESRRVRDEVRGTVADLRRTWANICGLR